MNIAFGKIIGGFGDKGSFVHTGGIAEMQLKNVTAGFDIKTDGKRIIKNAFRIAVGNIKIVQCEGYAAAQT